MMRSRPKRKGVIYLAVVLAVLLCAAAVALARNTENDGATSSAVSGTIGGNARE
jgi:hypothetical protein